MQARPVDARFHRQRHDKSQEREQRAQFVQVGQMRGLQREAFSFEIAEHGFYRPAMVMHSRATDGWGAFKCRGKWPDQPPRPPFGLPDAPVAVRTSRLSCGKDGKGASVYASLGVISGIPVNGTSG